MLCRNVENTPMSAREIIREIEALPPEERREVFDFVKTAESAAAVKVRYASVEQVKDVASRVFTVNDELFRKLAK
jgi:hypothetical protein